MPCDPPDEIKPAAKAHAWGERPVTGAPPAGLTWAAGPCSIGFQGCMSMHREYRRDGDSGGRSCVGGEGPDSRTLGPGAFRSTLVARLQVDRYRASSRV